MMKFYLSRSRYLTGILVLLTSLAWAQERTVTGKVTSSDDGSGIPGVNVIEKGSTNGSTTDENGDFRISVKETATLIVSFVGYTSQEIAVGARTVINVSLAPDITSLSEVVVIGYGEVQIRDVTGAVASVKAEDFNRGIISSPEQLIQGKMAGVQVTTSSGEPGAGVNLRIRGTSSVRGSNNPLFVVDGIPLTSSDISSGAADIGRGSGSPKNPLNFINPNDIESIDVLKDASSTAIYGSRGANGVVLVTTKNGRGKDKEFEYASTLSFSKQAKKFDLLSGPEFLDAYGDLGGDISLFDRGGDTDWQDEINRTALSHSHSLGYADSYEGGNFRASLSLDDQQGIIKNSGMERMTGRLNLNQNFLNEKLKFSTQMLFSRVNDQAAAITNGAGFEGDLLGSALMYNPALPATTEQVMDGDISNPLALLKYYDDNTVTDRNLINLSLSYDITDKLTFKVNTGFDRSHSFREGGYSSRLRNFQGVRGNGRAFFGEVDTDSDLLEAFLTYHKSVGSNGSLDVVAGYSYQEFRNHGRSGQGWGFSDHRNSEMNSDLRESVSILGNYIDQDYQQFAFSGTNLVVYTLDPIAVTTITPATAAAQFVTFPTVPVKSVFQTRFSSTDELQSFFGRVNYSMNDKYLFTASLRTDGSTRFGKNNKYGLFPAAAFAWRLSEEDFMPEVFEDLKFRLGYGVTGNQEIPHNLYQGRVRYNPLSIVATEGGRIDVQGPGNVAFANPDLKWEQTSQLNIGFDFSFSRGRLFGNLDFYNKVTTDLLMQTISAQPAPNTFVWKNLPADVVNSGVELTLNAVAVDKDAFGVNLGFNISYNKNMVKNYDGSPLPTGRIHGQGLTGAFTQRIANDQPLYTYFLREFVGYGEDGLNADDDIQRYVNRNPIPKYNLGFSLNIRYKAFDVATYFNGQFGHYIYNNVTNAFFTKGSIGAGRNVVSETVTSNESPANAPDVSTRFLEKGDFLRMQNLSIGYNVKLADDFFIKKLRISATGQNVFVLTSYSGLDPEVNVDKNIDGVPSLGVDYTAYPRARSIAFGINATF